MCNSSGRSYKEQSSDDYSRTVQFAINTGLMSACTINSGLALTPTVQDCSIALRAATAATAGTAGMAGSAVDLAVESRHGDQSQHQGVQALRPAEQRILGFPTSKALLVLPVSNGSHYKVSLELPTRTILDGIVEIFPQKSIGSTTSLV